MPRRFTESIDSIVQDNIAAVMQRIAPRIAQAIAAAVAARVDRELAHGPADGARRARPVRRRTRPQDMTRWVADNRARRVPNFVIDATGLDTKKKIIASYGENAIFERGKPLPPEKAGSRRVLPRQAARVVTAKPPLVTRKAAAQ